MATEDFGRRRNNLFFDESPFLVGVVGYDLKLKVANPAWQKILGYPREELLDRPLSRLVDRGEHAALLMLVNPRLFTAGAKPVEFSLRCKDGTYKCFLWERRPLPADQAMFVQGTDITQKKKMEVTANLQSYLRSRKT